MNEPSDQPQQPTPPRVHVRCWGTELMLWARALTSAGVYTTLIVTFVFQMARVEGRSMEPTLQDADRLVVNKLAYQIQEPQVGDIVMLLHPRQPGLRLVKRIVAGPGDTVAVDAGSLRRNGMLVEEDFIPAERRSRETLPAVTVPEGFYFVLGDHRNNSTDSRAFGAVPARYIIGRIDVRWWPPTRAAVYEP